MPGNLHAWLLISILLAGAAAGSAADFKSGKRVTITATDTLSQDLYAAGQTIVMAGIARHDLIFAGQEVELEGRVEENLYVGGEKILLSGTVRGDILAIAGKIEFDGVAESGLRGAAESLTLTGTVNGDVVFAGRELRLAREAVVNGDIIAACERIELEGTVHGSLKAVVDFMRFAGPVDHDAELTVGEHIDLESSARLGGNLIYRSTRQMDLQNTEVVAGEILFKEIVQDSDRAPWRWLLRLWFWMATLFVGFLMIAFGKTALKNVLERTLNRPLDTLGAGVMMLVATPILIVLSFVLILTIPLGLLLLLGFIIVIYLGLIVFSTFLGREIVRLLGSKSESLPLAMALGVTLLFVLTLIPTAGGLIWLFMIIAGMGTVILGLYETLHSKNASHEAKSF